MVTDKEQFFQLSSFAVVGNTSHKPFPKLTYRNLRSLGKEVYPVELGGSRYVEGDEAFPSLAALPQKVQGVIMELPRQQVLEIVHQVNEAGITELWLHQGSDTPQVLAFCREQGIKVRWGSCAVMYTQQGVSYHSVHKLIMKILGKY